MGILIVVIFFNQSKFLPNPRQAKGYLCTLSRRTLEPGGLYLGTRRQYLSYYNVYLSCGLTHVRGPRLRLPLHRRSALRSQPSQSPRYRQSSPCTYVEAFGTEKDVRRVDGEGTYI